MKKLIVLLVFVTFGKVFSSQIPESNEIFQSPLNYVALLRRMNYTQEQVETWEKLFRIAQKENQGLPLTNSETELTNLEDGIKSH
ncbi:hypothetical protein HYV10_01340 [Candidatus Dependentiae bacterium]|nr:hypothetical protein [Candidatus Dependentiae bacterium]